MGNRHRCAGAGITSQAVSKWENNSAVPELDKLIKMAQIFDITLDELVTGEQKSYAAPPPTPTAPTQEMGKAKLSSQQILIFSAISLVL